jgi:hypothetical protein
MSKKSLDDEREFCRKVYENWEFVRKIVELYAEGVSWRGCDKLDIESIKGGVRDMLVSGVGPFSLETQGRIQVPMPRRFSFEGEEPGHPFLWPMTQNAVHLDQMQQLLSSSADAQQMFLFIKKDICRGLGVPYELLGSTATTANGDIVMSNLITFVVNVKTWRGYLAYKLKLTWNEIWLTSELTAYGQVYQVFKAQGIYLRTLREESLSAAKSMLDSKLISRQTYEKWVKWF